jgi:hypothetical protein
MRICNQQTTSSIFNGFGSELESPAIIASVRGQLTSALRPDAKKVFVVVTDDEASGVDNTNFLTMLNTAVPNSKPVLFAFRGTTSRPGCDIAARGTAYENLATTTGGQVFDICDTDWSPNFAKLSEQVTAIANTAFVLQQPKIVKIVDVSVDGVPLTTAQYKVIGNSVEIDPSAFTETSVKVTVRYVY